MKDCRHPHTPSVGRSRKGPPACFGQRRVRPPSCFGQRWVRVGDACSRWVNAPRDHPSAFLDHDRGDKAWNHTARPPRQRRRQRLPTVAQRTRMVAHQKQPWRSHSPLLNQVTRENRGIDPETRGGPQECGSGIAVAVSPGAF